MIPSLQPSRPKVHPIRLLVDTAAYKLAAPATANAHPAAAPHNALASTTTAHAATAATNTYTHPAELLSETQAQESDRSHAARPHTTNVVISTREERIRCGDETSGVFHEFAEEAAFSDAAGGEWGVESSGEWVCG